MYTFQAPANGRLKSKGQVQRSGRLPVPGTRSSRFRSACIGCSAGSAAGCDGSRRRRAGIGEQRQGIGRRDGRAPRRRWTSTVARIQPASKPWPGRRLRRGSENWKLKVCEAPLPEAGVTATAAGGSAPKYNLRDKGAVIAGIGRSDRHSPREIRGERPARRRTDFRPRSSATAVAVSELLPPR